MIPAKLLMTYKAAAGSFTAFDPATVANVSLSNSNRTATSTATTNPSGARGLTADEKATGKYYFEFTGLSSNGGSQCSIGFNTPSATYASQVSSGGGGGGVGCFQGGSGAIFVNASNTGVSLGVVSVATDVIAVAVDMTHGEVWFKNITQGANWNNSGTANPATNVGGVAFTATPIVPYFGMGGGGTTGNVMAANFTGPFTGVVPAGFTSGWTTGP